MTKGIVLDHTPFTVYIPESEMKDITKKRLRWIKRNFGKDVRILTEPCYECRADPSHCYLYCNCVCHGDDHIPIPDPLTGKIQYRGPK